MAEKEYLKTDYRIEVLDRLYRYSDFEKRRATPYAPQWYNLDQITKLLNYLGHPQNSFRSFHVAGTKGKGSTTYFLAYLLEGMGIKTGHTVSPHLLDERDRFYFRGRKSSWEEIIPVFDEVLTAVGKAGITPTVFDIFTAVAFLYFKRQGVEVAVVETGMGGRWDSTNCLLPEELIACLITLIDYDHMDKLGPTLPLIAGEKAGIIKTGIPVFTSNPEDSVAAVFTERGRQVNAPVHFVREIHPLLQKTSLGEKHYIPPPILINLNLAVSSLVKLGYPLQVEHIAKAIQHIPLPGRYHKFKNLLLDGAHTVQSLRSFIAAIRCDPALGVYRKIKVFFYCLYDKDIAGLIRELPSEWELTFFDGGFPYIHPSKAAQVKAVVDSTWGRRVEVVRDLQSTGWREDPSSLFVFTGSFKLVGQVFRELEAQGEDFLG